MSETTPLLGNPEGDARWNGVPVVRRSGENRKKGRYAVLWMIPVIAVASMHHGAHSFARGASPSLLQHRLAYIMTNTLTSTLSTGFWCRLSDMVGRKHVLLVGLFGSLVADAFLILPSLGAAPSHADIFCFVGLAIEGLLGGFPTILAIIHSYVMDTSPAQSRLPKFSLLQATNYLFLILSSGLGVYNFRASLQSPQVLRFVLVVSFLSVLNLLWVLVLVPELRARKGKVEEDSSVTPRQKRLAMIWEAISPKYVLSPLYVIRPRMKKETAAAAAAAAEVPLRRSLSFASSSIPGEARWRWRWRRVDLRMVLLGLGMVGWTFATSTDNPLSTLPAPLPGFHWRKMIVPPKQDNTTIISPMNQGQYSLSSSPSFYDGGLGDDFDLYFFLFFILPILVPVVGLGVVVPVAFLLPPLRRIQLSSSKLFVLVRVLVAMVALQAAVVWVPYTPGEFTDGDNGSTLGNVLATLPRWLIATVMVIVFLVLPAIGSAAGVGMLVAAIVSSPTLSSADATTTLNTREANDRLYEEDDEHRGGQAEEGRGRDRLEDGSRPEGSGEAVDLDSDEVLGYGYGTLFGGMFVLGRWGECAYHLTEHFYLQDSMFGIPRYDPLFGLTLAGVIIVLSLPKSLSVPWLSRETR